MILDAPSSLLFNPLPNPKGKKMNKALSIKLLALLMLISIQYSQAQQTRTEKDLLGEKEIPADAYYGVQTLRALENFPISGVKTNFYPDLL